MKVYIAGKITGFPNYRQQFMAAERRLAELGFSVMNPAWVYEYPEFGHADYMAVTRAMLERCEAIFLLPGWGGSKGVKAELSLAKRRALLILDGGDAECWRALEGIAAKERQEREERLGKGLKEALRGWADETLLKLNAPGVERLEDAGLRGELAALRRVYAYLEDAGG